MYWPALIILYAGMMVWVLLYLVKLHKTALAESDVNPEAKSFVFFEGNACSAPMGQENIDAEKKSKIFSSHEYGKRPTSLKLPAFQNINIAHVTRDLIDMVMKMPAAERRRLADEITRYRPELSDHDNPPSTTKYLIEMIMQVRPEDRCALLSDVKTRMGVSRRKFARKNYMVPVYFVVRGMLANAYTKNFSSGGVLIETLRIMSRNFKSGESITMSLPHPRIRKEMKIHGKIIRVAPDAIAVSFDKPL